MQNLKKIAIFVAKSKKYCSTYCNISKYCKRYCKISKYCNTLQYYWNHPWCLVSSFSFHYTWCLYLKLLRVWNWKVKIHYQYIIIGKYKFLIVLFFNEFSSIVVNVCREKTLFLKFRILWIFFWLNHTWFAQQL